MAIEEGAVDACSPGDAGHADVVLRLAVMQITPWLAEWKPLVA
ncbi:hypothetical protein ACFQ0G_49460 [Streptomyces chiangmaiensis]